jgi:hypothetical protein
MDVGHVPKQLEALHDADVAHAGKPAAAEEDVGGPWPRTVIHTFFYR